MEEGRGKRKKKDVSGNFKLFQTWDFFFMSSSSSFEFELNFELYFVPNNTC